MKSGLILKNPLIIRRHNDRKEVIKTIRIKHCPKCGSTNINSPVFYRPSIWKCLDCGYEGAFIIEDGTLAEKCKSVPEIDATSSIGWKENPAWTIGTVKWTNGTELYCG
jgi:ribosomal protein L37AE/L43A